MYKYFALISLLALRLSYQPEPAQENIAAFAAPLAPAKIFQFKGKISGNKIILDWSVNDNETANLFEVERSTDGKNFSLAALVWGSDKPATDNYQFYEKAGNHKVLYRIKLVSKNKDSEYSEVITIKPKA